MRDHLHTHPGPSRSRTRSTTRRGAGVIALTVITLSVGLPAGASLVGDWQLNEKSGARTMHDASTRGLDGAIGSDVDVGVPMPDGSRGYRFSGWSKVNDQRLVRVPDNQALDPGTSSFAVTLRIKTWGDEPNIIQKGQSRSTGGYWKFVLHHGWPRCHFRDQNRKILAIGFVDDKRPATKANDNDWHTIRCELTTTGVRATIDSISKFHRGTLASVGNKAPMVIGGKLDCNGKDVGCDYYSGLINWVRVRKW